MSSITVVSRPALSLVGMCVRTNMEKAEHDCPKLWHEDFGPRMDAFAACCTGESYGVSFLVDEAAGSFDYWAAVPVPEDFPLPAGMSRTSLPEGLYAFTAVTSLAELSAAYTRIFNEWLPAQKAYGVSAKAPSYERYPADYLQTGALELYFPVMARS